MILPKDGKLLRIFIGEDDKYEGMPLYEWLVRRAREQALQLYLAYRRALVCAISGGYTGR